MNVFSLSLLSLRDVIGLLFDKLTFIVSLHLRFSPRPKCNLVSQRKEKRCEWSHDFLKQWKSYFLLFTL